MKPWKKFRHWKNRIVGGTAYGTHASTEWNKAEHESRRPGAAAAAEGLCPDSESVHLPTHKPHKVGTKENSLILTIKISFRLALERPGSPHDDVERDAIDLLDKLERKLRPMFF